MIILYNIISFLLLAYLANSFLSSKYNKIKSLLILVLFFIPLIFITVEFKYLFILFLYFTVCFLLYKGLLIQKALIIIPFYIIQVLLELLIFHIQTFFIYEIIFIIVFILLFIGVYIYILKHLKSISTLKYIKFIFIFPILTIIWFGDIDYSYLLSNHSTTALFDLLSIPLLNLLLFIITLLATNYLSLKKQKELFNSKYELLQQHYDYNFKFLHDLLHTCNQLNIQFNDQNYEDAKEILNQLTQTTYKEFNAIYSQSLVLNYVINSHLNTLIENNIDIKTTVETPLNHLDLQIQFQLFEYLLNFSIKSCLKSDQKNKMIIIKSKEQANYLFLKITLPYVVIQKNIIEYSLNKILFDISYILSIKQIDTNYISLLITFNI